MHSPKSSGTRARRALVFVVDDDPGCREAIARVLEHEGYGAVRVDGGAEAIELLEAGVRPLAMTLDLNMPVVDGHEVLLHLRGRADLANLPVIVVSASVLPGEMPHGASAVVPKPFDVLAFLEALRACTHPAEDRIALDAD
jgi:CheY-like chemotaxis protein